MTIHPCGVARTAPDIRRHEPVLANHVVRADLTNIDELSEALQKKIGDVAKARSHCVRRLSVEEADQIRQMAGWMVFCP